MSLFEGLGRRLWSWASIGLVAVWALAVALGVTLYLTPRHDAVLAGEEWVNAGPVDSLQVGEARLEPNELRPYWLVRVEDAKVVAVSASCTHLRCTVQWDRRARSFVCPCHADRWNLSGAVMSGPARRPLRSYTVTVRAREMWVHL